MTASYGRFPYWVVEGGHWATMTGSQRAIFGALCAHIKGSRNTCHPNQNTVARESGTSISTVYRVTRELERRGLLTFKPGRGHGNATEYTIPFTKPATVDERFVSHGKPVKSDTKTGQIDAGNRSNQTPKPFALDDGPIKGTEGTDRTYTQSLRDTVYEVFNLAPLNREHERRVAGIVEALEAKGATPEEVRTRAERYRRCWPKMAFTPKALANNWETFAAEPSAGECRQSNPARIRAPRGKYEGVSQRW